VAALIGASGYIWLLLGNPGGIVSTGVMTGFVPVSFPVIWGAIAIISIYAFRVYTPYKKYQG